MAATGAIMHFFGSNIQVDVMATSDNHMVDSENSETNSEATLKKQTVRFAELPRDEDDVEEVD